VQKKEANRTKVTESDMSRVVLAQLVDKQVSTKFQRHRRRVWQWRMPMTSPRTTWLPVRTVSHVGTQSKCLFVFGVVVQTSQHE